MRIHILLSLLLASLLLSSCSERTGYLDGGQQATVSLLTATDWAIVWQQQGDFPAIDVMDNTRVYRFETTGKGWHATISLDNPDTKDNIGYFSWTFTNRNYAVICMSESFNEYWLIEKLNRDELWVTSAAQDPVLYPNQYKTYFKLRAVHGK